MTCQITLLTASTAFGLCGLAGQLTWPLLKKREWILALQFFIAAFYGAQYAMLGQWSGTGVCAIGATQTLIALAAGGRPWLRFLGAGFIPLAIAVGLLTWSGPGTALVTTACCLIMLGRMQRDTLRMRAIMLAAAPFGIAFDLTAGAVPALAGAVLSACLAAAALRREWLSRAPSTGAARFTAS